MKKFLSIILTLAIVASFAACGKKGAPVKETSKPQDADQKVESAIDSAVDSAITSDISDKEDDQVSDDVKSPETEEVKPQEETKPEVKPEAKPEAKPETKPETKPEEKPETAPQPEDEAKPESSNKSIGNTLLADFKAKAASMNAQSLADSLLSNPIIPFSGASMPVEPGYLSGFDNAEIKGFSEGVMFAPMIGSIPFIGYVFTLDSDTDSASFISTLKANANKRWNICTQADEMVTGSVGNKVFFVMCPNSFEE